MTDVIFPFGPLEVNREGGLFFIFEMANSHQGDTEHGRKIISHLASLAKDRNVRTAIKFQFRQLDTFLHPGFIQAEVPISSNKHTKRFIDTRLELDDYRTLSDFARQEGLIPFATPFDETSVKWCVDLEYPVIKIASCSASDWPLLNRVAETGIPVAYSTAGASVTTVDRAVALFRERSIPMLVNHCVGLYPAPVESLQIDQIGQLKERYKDVVVGYSAHEAPSDVDVAALAIAAGASVLERHVALSTAKYSVNAYSIEADQIGAWMDSAIRAHKLMNAGRSRLYPEAEATSIEELKRGVYSKVDKRPGEYFSEEELFVSMPCLPGQFSSETLEEVIGMPAPHGGVEAMMPVMRRHVGKSDLPVEIIVGAIVHKAKSRLKDAKIALPKDIAAEVSHQYGLERYPEYGAFLIDVVNREYCKKIIVQEPGQYHPRHKHVKKEETFHVLAGELRAEIDGNETVLSAGDSITVNRGQLHSFGTETGMIMEEISTTHIKGDSVYEDENIPSDPATRKTEINL